MYKNMFLYFIYVVYILNQRNSINVHFNFI